MTALLGSRLASSQWLALWPLTSTYSPTSTALLPLLPSSHVKFLFIVTSVSVSVATVDRSDRVARVAKDSQHTLLRSALPQSLARATGLAPMVTHDSPLGHSPRPGIVVAPQQVTTTRYSHRPKGSDQQGIGTGQPHRYLHVSPCHRGPAPQMGYLITSSTVRIRDSARDCSTHVFSYGEINYPRPSRRHPSK